MSELKSFIVLYDGKFIRVYKENEANKVIAEKDAKIIALDAEVFKQKHHAKLFFDERNYAETQLRHQKYKRCLAMAIYCHEKSLWWYSKGFGFEKYDKFWEKWENRWLAMAKSLEVVG